MLGNSNSLLEIASDSTVEPKLSGPLQLLQELRWRSGFGVLKANILFIFDKEKEMKNNPITILIIEDCFVQLGDDNSFGKEFTFELKFKTTGKNLVFAAEDFKSLEKWVTVLTITPMDYINITKQSFIEQIDNISAERATRKENNSLDDK